MAQTTFGHDAGLHPQRRKKMADLSQSSTMLHYFIWGWGQISFIALDEIKQNKTKQKAQIVYVGKAFELQNLDFFFHLKRELGFYN